MAVSVVCCSVCLLLSRIHFKKPRISAQRCCCAQEFELLQEIHAAVASLPITQTSRSVRIKSDLLSHQTSPAGCGWLSALKPGTHSLSQGDSKMQHTRDDIPCYLFFFFSLRHLLQPERWCFPPPQKLRGGRFDRAHPWESLSFRPKPARCRVVDQVAPTGMPRLSRSL